MLTTRRPEPSRATAPAADPAPPPADAAHPPAAQPKTRAGAFFPCFDGYRALAAMTVVVTHVSFITVANRYGFLGSYFARFDIGVAFFFLISGFLLYRPFVAAAFDGRPAPRLLPYLRRRAIRIVPAYWLVLTVALFVFRTQPHLKLGDALFLYGFAQIYDTHHIVAGLPPAWSLDVEVSFYLFLPAWAMVTGWLSRRWKTLHVQLAGVLALYAISVAWRLWVMSPGWGLHAGPFTASADNALSWLPAMLDYFSLGMLLAVLRSAHLRSAGVQARPTGRLPNAATRPWIWWALGGVAFWVVSKHIGLPLDMRPYGEARILERQALYGLTALCILVPGVFGDQAKGWSRKALRTRGVVWLGTVSYGVYLWHEQWISQVQRWTGWSPFGGHFGPILVMVTALTVATAGLSYTLVERPLLRLKGT